MPSDQTIGAARLWLMRFPRQPMLILGLLIVISSVAAAILVPALMAEAGSRINLASALRPPLTGWHLAGTDQLGRDIFVRIATGLRVSFAIGACSVLLALVIGLTIGLVSGYFGGFADTILMRLTDVQMALPFIVLAIAILSVAQPGFLSLVIVLSLAAWPIYARVARGVVQLERNADYVLAAQAVGASSTRIITRYLLRSLIASTLVLSIFDLAAMIIYEATLSFIGLGLPPSASSLGSIMSDGKNYVTSAWWITGMPGLAMLYAIFGLNLVAVALRNGANGQRGR